jgi:hypothetical protein
MPFPRPGLTYRSHRRTIPPFFEGTASCATEALVRSPLEVRLVTLIPRAPKWAPDVRLTTRAQDSH